MGLLEWHACKRRWEEQSSEGKEEDEELCLEVAVLVLSASKVPLVTVVNRSTVDKYPKFVF